MEIKPSMNDPAQIKKTAKGVIASEREKLTGKAAQGEREKQGDTTATGGEREAEYFMRGGYLCRNKTTRDGDVPIRLANFSATISAENVLDNGLDQTLLYEIEGKLHGRMPLQKLEIPANNFAGMTWVNRWGASAVLECGTTVKDYVRHAIQTTSRDIKTTIFYSHTGWRMLAGKPVYLHGGGAIGADVGVSIKLPPELQRYSFPPSPPIGTEQAGQVGEAIETALDFLDIGKRTVMLPLFAFCFLAPLTTQLAPMPNFSLFLHGASGSFKSSLAVLALNFFGSFPGIENLSNFDDSDGALEMRAFILADSLACIDDLHPSTNKAAALLREGRLQRIIRSFGNRTSRARLNADLTSKNRYPPRGLLLITGEEQAGLESSIARLCAIEITHGAVSKTNLSAMQDRAATLSVAMRSYIEWLSTHLAEISADFPARFKELRTAATGDGLHGRLPEQSAYLQFSMERAVSWMVDSGVITDTRAEDLLSESWAVFKDLSAAQQRRIGDDDPVAMFLDIIQTLLAQNTCRLMPVVSGGGDQIGAGEVIGHYDDEFLYLHPLGVWHSVLRFCITEGTHFPFSKNTLFQMLRNRGIIQPSANGEASYVKKIQGKSYRILKVVGKGLYEKFVSL